MPENEMTVGDAVARLTEMAEELEAPRTWSGRTSPDARAIRTVLAALDAAAADGALLDLLDAADEEVFADLNGDADCRASEYAIGVRWVQGGWGVRRPVRDVLRAALAASPTPETSA